MSDKFDSEALTLLNNGLKNFPPGGVSRDELWEMYRTSQVIMQSNPENLREYQNAETVFWACVRVVRCLCLPEQAKYITLNGNEFTLNELDQFEIAQRNYSHILK